MYTFLYGLIVAMCISIIVVCAAITAAIVKDFMAPEVPESPDETVRV